MYLAVEILYVRDIVEEGDGCKYTCALDQHTLQKS